jgi:hypothetical protein
VRREWRLVREEGFELPKRMWVSREEEARVAARW